MNCNNEKAARIVNDVTASQINANFMEPKVEKSNLKIQQKWRDYDLSTNMHFKWQILK